MKKLITGMLAAAFALNTTVLADYYEKRERVPFDGNSISYEKYDIAAADAIINDIENLLGTSGNDEEIAVLMDKAYNEYVKASYASTAAQLISDRYYSEEHKKDATYAASVTIDVSEKLGVLFEDIYNKGYSNLLENMLDSDAEDVKEFIDSIPSERYYELSREENELAAQYSALYGDSDACAELFVKLAGVRREIAVECGYDSYADYANTEIYQRDYGTEELTAFSDAVSMYIVPLWNMLYALSSESYGGQYEFTSEADVIAKVKDMMYDLNTELGDSYMYMIDNHLYDIEPRIEKDGSAGAYTTTLPGKNTPYMFISYDSYDEAWMKAFVHESGHFCSLLNTPGQDEPWIDYFYAMSTDTCEVHSQGLEMLSEYYYGKLYGSAAADEIIDETLTITSCILDGCFYNEWQTRVYNEKSLTVDKANEIAAELVSKYYGMEDYKKSDAQEIWTIVEHNYLMPLYYISYAVSAAAALELYSVSVDDYEDAVDKYMQLSAMGGYVPFRTALEDAGMDDIFDPETLKEISWQIGESLGVTYIDVDYDSWYAPYLIKTANIADGRGTDIFEPQSNITRAEFVKLIGEMYDYYEGIDGSYTLTFNDVDAADDSAEYIMWASANGIVTGYSDTEFGPDDEITREQLVAMLGRLYRNGGGKESGAALLDVYAGMLDAFADINSVSAWAMPSMAWAAEKGIINGRENNMLAPKDNTTRAEAVKIAACYIDIAY